MNASMFGSQGGGEDGTQSSAAAASVIGGRNEQVKLETLMPWIVGGIVVVVLAIAAVAVAVVRR
jgi:crotonobetainyl-CoA:carnitine CoA-transferase CaiB-like acyl-CoA transferase